MSDFTPIDPSYPGLSDPLEAAPRAGFWSRLRSALGEVLQTLIIAGGLFLVVNGLTARIRVESVSMQPSLYEGDYVVVNRLAYRLGEMRRGDIIVFYFPLDPERRFIKRLIGLPGDQIVVHGGQVLVNGQPLAEPYLAAPPRYEGEWRVEDGELFVLGDNRNNSADSKDWGLLPAENVIGKAILVYWPPGDSGLIPHYDLAQAESSASQ
jgi:signal peptidase I